MNNKWLKEIYNNLKRQKLILPVGAVVIVIVLAFLIGPKLTGFATYSNQLSGYKTELENCTKSFGELEKQKADLEADVATLQNNLAEKEKEIEQLQSEYQKEIDDLNRKYEDATKIFDAVIANAGRNICCKLKYDIPEINSFTIRDNKIVCETDGTFAIDC